MYYEEEVTKVGLKKLKPYRAISLIFAAWVTYFYKTATIEGKDEGAFATFLLIGLFCALYVGAMEGIKIITKFDQKHIILRSKKNNNRFNTEEAFKKVFKKMKQNINKEFGTTSMKLYLRTIALSADEIEIEVTYRSNESENIRLNKKQIEEFLRETVLKEANFEIEKIIFKEKTR